MTKSTPTLLWVLIAVIAIVIVIALYTVSKYNSLVRSKNQVDEAFSKMDIYLVKRADLIPNLIETVKGATSHERETLESVVSARSRALSADGTAQRLEAEGELSQALSRLLMISESYPELKANQNFLQMQTDLRSMETEIENARNYYNGTVKYHNNAVSVFPASIVAKKFNFEKEQLFVAQEEQRANPKVEF